MKIGKVIILTLLVTISTLAILNTNVEHSAIALNKFRSYEELKEFLENRSCNGPTYFRDAYSIATKSSEANDYSKTNMQVQGVDEADIVKTDGEYLYVISGQKVIIVRAYPPEEAAVISTITFNGTLNQIFINQDRLVVFYANSDSQGEAKTFVHIYDVTDRENPLFKKEIAADGYYFSSRMIGDYVYVLTMKGAWVNEGEVNLPRIYSNGEVRTVLATDIYYSDTVDYGYMYTVITAVNVQQESQAPIEETILSRWTTNVYVSFENIYLAVCNWNTTALYRIHIENGEITYSADGEVSGRVLNQFSMDEYGDHFRIATTSQMTGSNEKPMPILALQNNLYVLNFDLDVVGKLEGVAPGESIHSARFMGNLCYLVTFRKIDPLFVIDLSESQSPKILGELEITGYSDYLHLYDENHVIGIGKETIAAEEGDFSWYQGVKISLFDVTDMADPKEMAKYEIGDRGSDSPVLRDHKAFLFDREKNLLVIPVSVAKIDREQYPGYVPPYVCGEIVWQGAYVFTVSLTAEEKLVLKGTITHVENDNIHDASYHIMRTLYIDEVLYTISENKIKMNSLLDMSEINELNLNG